MSSILRRLKRALKTLTYSKEERRHLLVGPAELWQMKRDFQIDFLKRAGLRPEHYLLDIGCGTLRGGIPIIDYLDTRHYFGIESRSEVLDEGKKELREANLEHKEPRLYADPDVSRLEFEQHMDFVWAFSVLIHMSDSILLGTLELVSRQLSDTGVFFANVNIGSDTEGKWQGFPVVWRSFDFYRDACAEFGLNAKNLGALKDLGHVTDCGKQDEQTFLSISKSVSRDNEVPRHV